MEIGLWNKDKVPSYGTLLFICCMVTFGCYFGSYMRLPVVPLFATALGADTFQVGLINSSFLLVAGLLSLPLGILSDRIGRKYLILIGLLVSSATSFLLLLAKTPMQMVWIYLFFGAGLAAFAPTMMSYVADISPSSHLGRSYGWYTMAIYCGMSLGPASGGTVAHALGFPEVFFLSGVFIFLMFWIVLIFLPRARYVVLNRSKARITSETVRDLLKNQPLLACWLVTLAGCFGLGMFVTFLPLHASEQGIDVGSIGLIFATQALFNALSRIPFGHFSDKVSNKAYLVFWGLVGLAISMGCFGVSLSLLEFLLSSVALGVSMGITFTALGALISEVVPANSRGLAMGGYNTCIYLGMMLSSLIMGASIRGIGFRNSFLLTALANLLAAIPFASIMKEFPASKSHTTGSG